jgi:hypothetical protein
MDGRVNKRFEIEEIVTQNEGSVVYRALDRETNRQVALRRLLPRGIDGGGLDPRQAEEYLAATDRLARVRVVGLRGLLLAGVDEIDGKPWLVTEWVEGESLAQALARGTLSPEAGRRLAEQALTVQVVLDAQAGGWHLDTRPSSVVVVAEGDDFGFSFWMEPYPDPHNRPHAVAQGLANLLEKALGWHRGQMIAGPGAGLAEWIHTVHQHRLSAASALEALASLDRHAPTQGPAAPAAPPAEAVPPAGQKSQSPAKAGSHFAIGMLLVSAVTVVLLIVLFWGFTKGGWNHRLRQRSLAAEQAKANGNLPLYQSGQAADLRESKGKRVRVEGVLADVRESLNARYLEFASEPGPDQIAARILSREVPGLKREDIQSLIGKKLRVAGEVWLETDSGRVVIDLTDKLDIEVDN